MQPIIDIHIHIMPLHMFNSGVREMIVRGRKDLADVERYAANPREFLKMLDDLGIERAGLINDVSPRVTGFKSEMNDWIAKYASVAPERLLAFGSVHPRTVPDAGAEVDRIASLGIRGLKLHPPHQEISPNAYRDGYKPLEDMYRRAQANGLPLMIHTGTSMFPGARNIHAQPMLCDDVGVDFPDLTIILAHGGRPLWMNEAFFLVRRHKNMYMDISGIPPLKLLEHFPRIEEVADKVLWGTDWPGPGVPEIKANLKVFRELPIGELAKRKILYDNAARLFPCKV